MDERFAIYGNVMSEETLRKAEKSKQKYIRKFGDDSDSDYKAWIYRNDYIGKSLGVSNVGVGLASEMPVDVREFNTNRGIIVGNIRMGFGHYRISMAMASCANYLGYKPYWMDLNSYPETTCTKVISAQNDLYSKGSRMSQKSKLFNKLVWEPMNYEGFRKLSYNCADQKNAELMAPVFNGVPKNIPVIATHVWPAQAAIHAGMKYVVNAVPDNWPMALHYAEGALHTVQCHYAYQGYRIANGMNGDKVNLEMPADSLAYTGHYIDHELVANIENDCERRLERKKAGKPIRYLLTIGGAGAQKEIFAAIINELMPDIEAGKASILLNIGDYQNVWQDLVRMVPGIDEVTELYFDEWERTQKFASDAMTGDVNGIKCFCHSNIFEAVYCTNLLMRCCDVLVTKPSELAFYPVPKIFIKRIGGHEQWGAIHSAEMGDGSLECRDIPHTLQMIRLFADEDAPLYDMCNNTENNKKAGIYDGGYNVVKLARGLKSRQEGGIL